MRRLCFTKPTPLIAGLLSGLLCAILAVPLSAATKAEPFYDINKEVQISGMASRVIVAAPQGMMPGSHVLIETESGSLDASLGKWALAGKGALSIQNGEQVTAKGVMKTVKDKQVFIVRTIEAGGHTYTIRNEHGVPVAPQSREHMSTKVVQKGVAQ